MRARRGVLLPTAALLTMGLIGIVVSSVLGSTAATASPALERTLADPALTVRPGQVVHVITTQYERPDRRSESGPPHLDPLWLSPATQTTETWAVIGDGSIITRLITYTRDSMGQLIQQSVLDSTGQRTVFEARRNMAALHQAQSLPSLQDLGPYGPSKEAILAAQHPQTTKQESIHGRQASVLEYTAAPDPETLRDAKQGKVAGGPYLADLDIKEFGRRLAYDQASAALLRDVRFAVTSDGQEYVLRSQEWLRFEVLDRAQVPADVLSPAMPTIPEAMPQVRLRTLSVAEAAQTLPFGLFTLDPRTSRAATSPVVTYAAGPPIDPATLPVTYRGLMFAVQRGEAAELAYEESGRYLALIQGPAARIAASLRQASAFWSDAMPVSIKIGGASIDGWYLTSAPITITSDPASGALKEVPGPTWILLPDVQGTGILIRAHGYTQADLLAVTARLQRTA